MGSCSFYPGGITNDRHGDRFRRRVYPLTLFAHNRIAITLDIYSHVSLELEKQGAAGLNAVFRGGQHLSGVTIHALWVRVRESPEALLAVFLWGCRLGYWRAAGKRAFAVKLRTAVYSIWLVELRGVEPLTS